MLLAKGAFVGGLQYALSHTGGGNDNKFTADGFARSLAIGALSAGAASAIGGIAQNIGGVNGTIFQAGAHALSQGVFSTLQGGSFQSGVASGLFGSISAGNGGSALDMIGSAAFVGGMASAENGEGFWKGAAQAGIVAGFNHVGHRDGYSYNGTTYSSKAELYAAILADQSMEQFGVLGILEVAGVVAGQPNLMKRFVQTGSSDGTSILSKNLRKLPLGAFKKAQWAPTLRNLLATTTGRGAFIARWIPWIGSGMLMYDAGMSLYNTQLIFNKITANGR